MKIIDFRCQEIEELIAKHDMSNIHRKNFKEITGNKKHQPYTNILYEESKLVTNNKELEEIWITYISVVFDDINSTYNNQTHTEQGPDIIVVEVEKACIKTGKSRSR